MLHVLRLVNLKAKYGWSGKIFIELLELLMDKVIDKNISSDYMYNIIILNNSIFT